MTHKSVYFSFAASGFLVPQCTLKQMTGSCIFTAYQIKKDSHYVKKVLYKRSASTQGQGLNKECINGSRKLHVCDCNGQLMNKKILLFQRVATGKSNICLTFLNRFIPSLYWQNTKMHGLFSHFSLPKKWHNSFII